MQSLVSGPWDHDLSQRWMLNQLSHPGALDPESFNIYILERGCLSFRIIEGLLVRNKDRKKVDKNMFKEKKKGRNLNADILAFKLLLCPA